MAGANVGGNIAIAAATTVFTVVAGEISKRAANAIVGDPQQHEARMYDEIQRKLDQSHFNIPRREEESSDMAPRKMKRQGARAGQKEPSQVMDYIHEVKDTLKKAKGSTRCGVCIKGIEAMEKSVEENSQTTVRADAKWNVMQDLKKAGKIPKNATWNTLNSKQKNFVNRYVEGLVKNGID
jgi:hypothetical protein